ncbi:MAG: calcium-binding EGF-like domain-containing protein [Bacteroidia bacterium]
MKKIIFYLCFGMLLVFQTACDKNNCAKTCQNGGTCEGVACKCPDGYTGLYCESVVDTCASLNCGLHGTCVTNVPQPYCACDPGYTGPQCTQTWSQAVAGTYTVESFCPAADAYEVQVQQGFHGNDFTIVNFQNKMATYPNGSGGFVQVPVKLVGVFIDPNVFVIEPQTLDFSDPGYVFTISGGGQYQQQNRQLIVSFKQVWREKGTFKRTDSLNCNVTYKWKPG